MAVLPFHARVWAMPANSAGRVRVVGVVAYLRGKSIERCTNACNRKVVNIADGAIRATAAGATASAADTSQQLQQRWPRLPGRNGRGSTERHDCSAVASAVPAMDADRPAAAIATPAAAPATFASAGS